MALIHPEGTDWVLVKGYTDSGRIERVLGPYTEEHTDWLLSEVLDCSSYNWTKIRLQTGPLKPSEIHK